MPNTYENNSIGKPGQRNRKQEQQRKQKPDKQRGPKPDRQQDDQKQIDAAVASTDISTVGAVASTDTSAIGAVASTDISPIDAVGSADISPIGAVTPTDTSSIGAVGTADISSIGFQTIATAYSDYIKKSFEQTRSFVEKLSGVRSLDKAIEIQTEFAKQAYETFVAESQRIRELYSELAKQSFKPVEDFVAKAAQAAR